MKALLRKAVSFKNRHIIYRKLEKQFYDFKEQEFVEFSKEIYKDLIKYMNLKMHCFLIRTLDKSLHNDILSLSSNKKIIQTIENLPTLSNTSNWKLGEVTLNENSVLQQINFTSNHKNYDIHFVRDLNKRNNCYDWKIIKLDVL